MPQRPPSPCAEPGCGELTTSARCDEHRRARYRAFDDRRGSASERGYDAQWQRVRDAHIEREPWCRTCFRAGDFVPGRDVDHVIPHRGAGWLFDMDANLQTLCPRCHNRKSGKEASEWPDLLYPLNLPTPQRPTALVCGPPGSGKTTYAIDHSVEGDDLVDLDQIRKRLEYRPLGDLLAERNRLLHRLLPQPGGTLWFVVGASRRAERAFWSHQLGGPDPVVRTTPLETCEARIRERGRSVDALLRAAGRWWKEYEVDEIAATWHEGKPISFRGVGV